MRVVGNVTVVAFCAALLSHCGRPNMGSECSMDGLGNRRCDFTNTGKASGSALRSAARRE
jgi:hypothetical protein